MPDSAKTDDVYEDPAFASQVPQRETQAASRRSTTSTEASDFKALRGFGRAIVAVGYVGLALALLLGVVGLAQVLDAGVGVAGVVGVLLGAGTWMLLSLLLAAAGQAIQCFLAVEKNTREAMGLLQTIAGPALEATLGNNGEEAAGSAIPDDAWKCRCGEVNPEGTALCEACGRSPNAVI